jgi:hypothetical protein
MNLSSERALPVYRFNMRNKMGILDWVNAEKGM